MVKHTIELKMPKLFKRKKNEDGTEETEVSFTDNEVKKAVNIIVPIAIGFAVGYMVGRNKGIKSGSAPTYIIK